MQFFLKKKKKSHKNVSEKLETISGKFLPTRIAKPEKHKSGKYLRNKSTAVLSFKSRNIVLFFHCPILIWATFKKKSYKFFTGKQKHFFV